MRKVLIVSYYFPPINMIASKRYGTMCRYFEEYGYKPYIITTTPDTSCFWKVGFDLDLPVAKEQIIRIGRMRDGIRVRSRHTRLLLKLMEKSNIRSRTITGSSIGWYNEVKEKIDIRQLQDIDIIIGTFPPMENLFVAKYLSKKLGCPYVAEIRDLISDYTERKERPSMGTVIDFFVEKKVLETAEGIISVTPGFRSILKRRYPDKPHKVIYNGWDEERKPQANKEIQHRYLYYAGSFYQHRLESFQLLVKCMKQMNAGLKDKIELIVRSIGPQCMDMEVKKIIQQEHMTEYIKILYAVSEDVVRAEQEGAYINIILGSVDDNNTALQKTIPGKVYELIQETAPVLAIAAKKSAVGNLLEYTNKGIASTEEDEIMNYILHTHRQYLGNENIQYFSRRKQAKRVCRFLDQVLDREKTR